MSGIRDEWTTEDSSVRLLLGDCLEILPGMGKGRCGGYGPFPYGVGGTQSNMRKQMGHKCSTLYSGVFDDSPEYIETVVVKSVEVHRIAKAVAVTPG